MTQRKNITVIVKGDDVPDFEYTSSYTEELYNYIKKIDDPNPEFVLLKSTFEAALDELRKKLGK